MSRFVMNVAEEVSLIKLERETPCRSNLLFTTVFLVACLFPTFAFSQNDNWLGGTGNWSDASKWSAGVPTATSNVFIDNGNAAASAVTVDGGFVCNTLTIDANDSLTITSGNRLDIFGTSITNRGNINVTDNPFPAFLSIATSQNVTLTGGGTVTLTDASNQAAALINGVGGSTLTNVNNTIQGSGSIGQGGPLAFVNQAGGVVNGNQAGRGLLVSAFGGVTNQGLMEATSGGSLGFSQNLTVNNAGGTISSSGSGSLALLINITQGGTLKTSGGGVMQGEGTLDGATHGAVNNQGTFTVPGGHSTTLTGTINNMGTFVVDDTAAAATLAVAAGQNVTLTGGGTVTLIDTANQSAALIVGGVGSTLTNVNNTIQGWGQIGQIGGLAVVNQRSGIINANQAGHGLLINANGGVTNQGLMEATNGSAMNLSAVVNNSHTIQTKGAGSLVVVPGTVTNTGTFTVGKGTLFQITGTFTNFSGTTLTGGTYTISGTLQFIGANIVTDAAHITLTGATSAIVDQAASDGLRNFAAITSKGLLALHSGRTLVTPGAFSNAGKLTAGVGTNFKTTSSYTQTGGTTTVDGTLTAPAGTTVQAGKVFGKGTIASTVVSSGAVTAGDSPTKTAKLAPGTYTQNANGSLNIAIGGLTAGTQYGELAVTNGASLNGILNLTLINNFLPAIGDIFTILTSSARTAQFATVNGLSINGGEHFQISYGPANVTLTVASGP